MVSKHLTLSKSCLRVHQKTLVLGQSYESKLERKQSSTIAVLKRKANVVHALI